MPKFTELMCGQSGIWTHEIQLQSPPYEHTHSTPRCTLGGRWGVCAGLLHLPPLHSLESFHGESLRGARVNSGTWQPESSGLTSVRVRAGVCESNIPHPFSAKALWMHRAAGSWHQLPFRWWASCPGSTEQRLEGRPPSRGCPCEQGGLCPSQGPSSCVWWVSVCVFVLYQRNF